MNDTFQNLVYRNAYANVLKIAQRYSLDPDFLEEISVNIRKLNSEITPTSLMGDEVLKKEVLEFWPNRKISAIKHYRAKYAKFSDEPSLRLSKEEVEKIWAEYEAKINSFK